MTTFEQLNFEDITYTNFNPGIWTVTEQSLGITCACLPTLRPLFGRILSGSANASGRPPLIYRESGEIQLPKLSGKPSIKRFPVDESARGFARLPKENMPSSSITNRALTGSKIDEGVLPRAILRSQLIEQHYDNMDRV